MFRWAVGPPCLLWLCSRACLRILWTGCELCSGSFGPLECTCFSALPPPAPDCIACLPSVPGSGRYLNTLASFHTHWKCLSKSFCRIGWDLPQMYQRMNLHNCSLNKIKFTFQLLSLKCYFWSSMCFLGTRRTCCLQCLCRFDRSVIRLSTGCSFRRFMLGYHILMAVEGFG